MSKCVEKYLTNFDRNTASISYAGKPLVPSLYLSAQVLYFAKQKLWNKLLLEVSIKSILQYSTQAGKETKAAKEVTKSKFHSNDVMARRHIVF